jgi:predicted DsbA family dithiol-disulfide isomerase
MSDFVVDVWSDVVCPFCYLGSRHLERALARFEHRDAVTVRHRAFELDPRTPTVVDRPLAELVAAKYGMPVERAEGLHRRLEGEAAALGMTWHFDRARVANTFDAHRLIALATSQGRGSAMADRLFQAYFSDGEVVSDHETLTRLGAEVGVVGCDELWGSDAFEAEVRADEDAALERGITGVPSLVIDGRFLVVGAQGDDAILSALERAWERRDHAS